MRLSDKCAKVIFCTYGNILKRDHELTPAEWHNKYGDARPRRQFLDGPLKGMLSSGPFMDMQMRLEFNHLIAPERLSYESDRAYCQRISIAFPDLIDDCLARLGWDK